MFSAKALLSRGGLATLGAALAVIAIASGGPGARVAGTVPAAQAEPSPPGTARLTVFISDLHLGVGRDAGGAWSPYEDFRWAPEFAEFLRRVDREGGGHTDLVLNGDTFELWQSLTRDCAWSGEDVGCSEREARRRMQHVLAQHRAELQALGAFAAAGTNTVTLVPGNHDAGLLVPSVAGDVLGAIPAPAGRVRVASTGYWLSPDGLVYAEHGHQIGEEVNRFEGWPRPFLPGPDGQHLRRPWGENFVQSYYNAWEGKYPIIDNIASEAASLRYGMAVEGALSVAVAGSRFVRFFLFGVSAHQFLQSLGDQAGTPVWDVARIRQDGDRFIVESFPAGDPLRAEAARAAAQGGLPLSVTALTDDEIRAICEERARLAERHRRTPDPRFDVQRCPTREGLGAAAQYLFGERDKVFTAHVRAVREALGPGARRFAVFVYSHTHLVDAGFHPMARTSRDWNPHVINTGAWQRVVSPETVARWNKPDREVLATPLEALPACYSLVWVAPYTGTPAAQVRSWRRTPAGGWDLGPICEG